VTTRSLFLAGLLIGAAAAVSASDARDAVVPAPNPVLAAADSAWARRDEGRSGVRASASPISEAVSEYSTAAAAPDSVEARWKLARALFFQGKFTGLDRDAARELFEKAREAGEAAIAVLRRRASVSADASPAVVAAALAGERNAAPTFFWTAVAWGEWGQLAPKLKAAKAGAATKVRDYASTVIALDPAFEEGGGYRVLGRLHDRAPKIPFVTGWVSREEALRNLRLAVRAAPRNFVNRHFLAEALAGSGGPGKKEAIRLERELLADAPSPDHVVEDAAIQDQAKRNLLAWTSRS
jgi:hypothetical protein